MDGDAVSLAATCQIQTGMLKAVASALKGRKQQSVRMIAASVRYTMFRRKTQPNFTKQRISAGLIESAI